jgi:hypothetical protein
VLKGTCPVREGAVGEGPSGDTARNSSWKVYGRNGTSLAAYFMKQNLTVRQDVLTPSTALSATEALEQQVRAHPVVQEVMRLFDARLVAITPIGARVGDGRFLAVEQQTLCFSSQEP